MVKSHTAIQWKNEYDETKYKHTDCSMPDFLNNNRCIFRKTSPPITLPKIF